jgi:transcriptional regulator with XRE-family HTH domain
MAYTEEKDVVTTARKAQQMSLRDFAAELGISHVAVSHWEDGTSNVDLNRVVGWMGDRREWVRKMAGDLLSCKIPGMREAIGNYIAEM